MASVPRQTLDEGFEPCGCAACGEVASVQRHSQPGTAHLKGLDVAVTRVWRECVSCGETCTNTADHDWRLEARDALNLLLGNPIGTRLPGVVLLG